jgi:hypothetical protein
MFSNRGHAILAYTIEVENEETHEWYSVHVDATNGEVVNIADYTRRLTSVRSNDRVAVVVH